MGTIFRLGAVLGGLFMAFALVVPAVLADEGSKNSEPSNTTRATSGKIGEVTQKQEAETKQTATNKNVVKENTVLVKKSAKSGSVTVTAPSVSIDNDAKQWANASASGNNNAWMQTGDANAKNSGDAIAKGGSSEVNASSKGGSFNGNAISKAENETKGSGSQTATAELDQRNSGNTGSASNKGGKGGDANSNPSCNASAEGGDAQSGKTGSQKAASGKESEDGSNHAKTGSATGGSATANSSCTGGTAKANGGNASGNPESGDIKQGAINAALNLNSTHGGSNSSWAKGGSNNGNSSQWIGSSGGSNSGDAEISVRGGNTGRNTQTVGNTGGTASNKNEVEAKSFALIFASSGNASVSGSDTAKLLANPSQSNSNTSSTSQTQKNEGETNASASASFE